MLEYGGLVEGRDGTNDMPMLRLVDKLDWAFVMKEEREMNELTCNLAAYAHEAWSGWMKHQFNKCEINKDGTMTIPADMVSRWIRQSSTEYEDLPVEEQISDVAEAHKMIAIFDDWTA